MRHLRCSQLNPQHGEITINIRFINKELFMRFSQNNPQKIQMINQLRQKGADIVELNNWIKINMFKNQSLVKLGNIEFDVEKVSGQEVENILFDFYREKYIQAKFKAEEVVG